MTQEEMATFRDYAKSEIVRLMKKRILEFRDVQLHTLESPTLKAEDLRFIQGMLHGLSAAMNLTDPAWGYDVPKDYVKKEEEKAKPLISARERAEIEKQASAHANSPAQ